MILAEFTEMIGISLKNFVFRLAVVNLTDLLLLLFTIRINVVSSLHVATVETQRYAFLLFSVVMTVATGELFAFLIRCLLHATGCSHRKLFCIQLVSCVKFSTSFSEGNCVCL